MRILYCDSCNVAIPKSGKYVNIEYNQKRWTGGSWTNYNKSFEVCEGCAARIEVAIASAIGAGVAKK